MSSNNREAGAYVTGEYRRALSSLVEKSNRICLANDRAEINAIHLKNSWLKWADSETQGALCNAGVKELFDTVKSTDHAHLLEMCLLMVTDTMQWIRGGDSSTDWQISCKCKQYASLQHVLECQHSLQLRIRAAEDLYQQLKIIPALRAKCELKVNSPSLIQQLNAIFDNPDSRHLLRLRIGAYSKPELQQQLEKQHVSSQQFEEWLLTDGRLMLFRHACLSYNACRAE